MLRIIRSADYTTRPWKNGGGTTRDIVVSPPGASLDDFDWRLSLAHVEQDGPFSRFENVDRTLVLLDGAMTLHDRNDCIELVRNEPAIFAGEREIEATLAGGSTLDFNVMTRRGRKRHVVRCQRFSERTSIEAPTGRTIALFVLEGTLIVDREQFGVHDTAIIVSQRAVVAAASGASTALVIEIDDIHPNVL